jgi:hypothetical protein
MDSDRTGENSGNIPAGDGQSETVRRILQDLSSGGGVSALVATSIYDNTTGQATYMDRNGNALSQAQVDA